MAQVGLLEDNSRIANLCATILQYAGHQVTIYEHPRACLDALLPSVEHPEQLLRSCSPPLDVLILDLNLPDIPGMEVLRSLREHPHTRSLPLIFCTAAPASEIARALRLAPQASCLEKPFTYNDLLSTIENVLVR